MILCTCFSIFFPHIEFILCNDIDLRIFFLCEVYLYLRCAQFESRLQSTDGILPQNKSKYG